MPEGWKAAPPRWRYLALAALIFVLAAALLAGLWQVSRAFPGSAQPTGHVPATAIPSPTRSSTASPAPTAPPVATPSPVPMATPAVQHPQITELEAQVDNQDLTITFRMAPELPEGRQIAEVLLWYDTVAGHQVRRFSGPLPPTTRFDYTLDSAQEGLTTTLTTGQLDYWWLVRDTRGESARAGGTVRLGPALEALVVPPAPQPPPAGFTWAISETRHYIFHYAPGTEAGRDLPLIGAVAESALSYITPTLDVALDQKLTVYLTPRVFWQGGAAYGGKTILISYLDRNYTNVEIWSYFTHEATHAVAQDLVQPKEEGGPDGVLVEGLAVWASDGHYGREPVDAWAAVIAESEGYLPLDELRAGPFYDFQHETAYLEAGSFVGFLIERYGLDKFKALYGRATGKPEHDGPLVMDLYGKSYAELEKDWLATLARLSPTPQQAEAWQFRVRFFDLMRRYQSELDPDARILPPAPTEWQSDTLRIFLNRAGAPVNIVLETALIAARERAMDGDFAAANTLLDEVEAAVAGGGLPAEAGIDAGSLSTRRAIVALLAAQDRAVLRADARAFRQTLDPVYALALGTEVEDALAPPFTRYWQELVRLDIAADEDSARGVVLLHGALADGRLPNDGRLFAIELVKTRDRWLLSNREPLEPELAMPPRREPAASFEVWGPAGRVTRTGSGPRAAPGRLRTDPGSGR